METNIYIYTYDGSISDHRPYLTCHIGETERSIEEQSTWQNQPITAISVAHQMDKLWLIKTELISTTGWKIPFKKAKGLFDRNSNDAWADTLPRRQIVKQGK